MLEPAANAGAAVSAARMNAQTAASRKQTRATESLIGGLRNGGVYSWCEDVIAGRTEAFDHGKLDQPACCATPGEVAAACHLGDDGIAVEPEERHRGGEHAGALVVALVQKLAGGGCDDRVRPAPQA